MKKLKKALKDLAEILSSDFAFEADCVSLDLLNNLPVPVTEREKTLAKVVHDCYEIVHPLTSDCCGEDLTK